MLKGINPILTPQLLMTLADMGHGDEIVIADANFTASSLAREAGMPVLRLPGIGARQVVNAVLSLMALDAAVEQPVAYMQVCDRPDDYRSRLQRDVVADLAEAGWARPEQCQGVERFAFYERTRRAFAIVVTGETQPYGNFILKKGVIGEALVE